MCEVRVEGYNYVGAGNSTNKKDAQSNAAKDFVSFLVRQGFVNKNDVPADIDAAPSPAIHSKYLVLLPKSVILKLCLRWAARRYAQCSPAFGVRARHGSVELRGGLSPERQRRQQLASYGQGAGTEEDGGGGRLGRQCPDPRQLDGGERQVQIAPVHANQQNPRRLQIHASRSRPF